MRRIWIATLVAAMATEVPIIVFAQDARDERESAPESGSGKQDPSRDQVENDSGDEPTAADAEQKPEVDPRPGTQGEDLPEEATGTGETPPLGVSAPATASPVAMSPQATDPAGFVSNEEAEQFDNLSLAELMGLSVAVATTVSQKLSTTPGIIAVVTRDQIERSGARDLLDILHQVPGFTFALHVSSSTGPMVRGNWAHEGKTLVLIDGIEMNEILWLTHSFGNHIPASLIERVEIIRGPGSVVYGGYAELAVVSVHTRRAQRKGSYSEVSGVYGQREEGFARRGVTLLAGHKSDVLGGTEITFSTLLWGQGTRSEKDYTDFSGNTISLKNNSQLDANHLTFGLNIHDDLKVKILFDRAVIEAPDGITKVIASPPSQDFDTMASSIEYRWQLADWLSLTPRISYKQQRPWRVTEEDQKNGLFLDKVGQRLVAALLTQWLPWKDVNVLLGGQFTHDRARLNDPDDANLGLNAAYGEDADGNPITKVHYTNTAGFFSAGYNVFWANDFDLSLTLGGRVESHSAYGNSLVPSAADGRNQSMW